MPTISIPRRNFVQFTEKKLAPLKLVRFTHLEPSKKDLRFSRKSLMVELPGLALQVRRFTMLVVYRYRLFEYVSVCKLKIAKKLTFQSPIDFLTNLTDIW